MINNSTQGCLPYWLVRYLIWYYYFLNKISHFLLQLPKMSGFFIMLYMYIYISAIIFNKYLNWTDFKSICPSKTNIYRDCRRYWIKTQIWNYFFWFQINWHCNFTKEIVRALSSLKYFTYTQPSFKRLLNISTQRCL